MKSMVWSIYLLGCWRQLPRSDPSKVNICYCRSLVLWISVWMMSMFFAMLTKVNIKTLIFHMGILIRMLAFDNLKWPWKRSNRGWVVLKKSITLKLDGFRVDPIGQWMTNREPVGLGDTRGNKYLIDFIMLIDQCLMK